MRRSQLVWWAPRIGDEGQRVHEAMRPTGALDAERV
jgi:hypothetical protein